MFAAFMHGLILAFGLIIPLGVQNVYVFNQGATHSRLIQAVPSIMTAFLCDMTLILLSVLGISLIVMELPWLKLVIFSVGVIFLSYMGWVTWKAKPHSADHSSSHSAKRQILFAISVSILNPHAVIDTVAVIGSNSLQYLGEAKWAFTGACILVSFLWFWAMAISGRVLQRMDHSGTWLLRINKLSAIIIWSVAIYISVQLIELIRFTDGILNFR